MKKLLFGFFAAILAASALVSAQTYSTTTTLSAAITSTSQTQVLVAAATSIAANTTALVVDGEWMPVVALNGTTVTVVRTGAPQTHLNGATVIVSPIQAGISVDPPHGSCTASNYQYLPLINTQNGNVWLCWGPSGLAGTIWKATNAKNVTYNSLLTSLS